MKYRGLELDRFQKQAIEAIDADKSVLVSAPTGTGKTLIADYLVDHVLAGGGRIVYTAPIKALSNQKYREYSRQHSPEQVGIVTGDVVINHDAQLRIMTTEILRNILLQGAGPDGSEQNLGELEAVIFDELHFIDDPDRGTVWEEVLIYLPDTVRILGLSATLSNLRELAGWLSSVREGPFGEVAVIEEKTRAVPLGFSLASKNTGLLSIKEYEASYKTWRKDAERDQRRADTRRGHRGRGKNDRGRGRGGRNDRDRDRGRGRGGRGGRRNPDGTSFDDMVALLGQEDLPALFFMFSRRGTENCARIMARRHKGYLSREESDTLESMLNDFDDEHEGVLDRPLVSMYRKGIAFHHAGLNVRLKALVEMLYEKRLIKLLFCTSTFALGINMPARTVLFEQLEKFNGEAVVPLTVRQFMQKAGRAGRRGLDDEGQVIVKMDFEDWSKVRPQLLRLMSDEPEPVRSSFNLSFHSIVHLLQRHSEDEIRHMLGRSFLAWQRANRQESIQEELERQERLLIAETDESSKLARKVRKLKRRVEREKRWLWDQFQGKVAFLRVNGYINDENKLGVGGRILRRIQIEEIFVTELVVAGVFEDLSPEEIFGMCAGLVQSLPRKTFIKADLPWDIEQRLDTVLDILEGPIVGGASELVGGEPHCDGDMMALGCLWAEGKDLATIMRRVRSDTDIAGDLVGAFRRAKDLVGQLRLVFWEDEGRRKALMALMKDVSRDEVEAVG